MRKTVLIILALFLVIGISTSGASALNIVATMPNVWDVTQEIGGDKVTVIYAAPPTAVHISSDTIDGVLQQNSEFIRNADLFIGQGGGMDSAAITKISEFVETNFDKKAEWNLMNEVEGGVIVYDNPNSLEGYATTVCIILQKADPSNSAYYAENLDKYLSKVSEVTVLSNADKELLSSVPIICHFRIKNQAETWLGMNVITSYPQPETVQAIIDDIHAEPSKYLKIAQDSSVGKIFVIENIVAGQDIGKGIHEALKDENIPCERVIFLNLPKSADGIDSILEYYSYNKALITDLAKGTGEAKSPVGIIPVFGAVLAAAVLLASRN